MCLLLNPSLSGFYIENARSGGRNAAELHAKIRKSFSGCRRVQARRLLLLSAGRCCCRVIEKGKGIHIGRSYLNTFGRWCYCCLGLRARGKSTLTFVCACFSPKIVIILWKKSILEEGAFYTIEIHLFSYSISFAWQRNALLQWTSSILCA